MSKTKDKTKNRFKSSASESSEKKNGKQKEERSRKSRKPKTLNKPFRKLSAFVRDDRVRKVTGLFLVLVSVYLFIAFFSFLFTWQADQNIVANPSWGTFLLDATVEVENWLGKLGALAAHVFIHQWFGVPSFGFVILFMLLGVRTLFRISLLPLPKVFSYGIFLLIWSSITLGYVFSDDLFFLGGAFGFHANVWLQSIIGYIGTAALLTFSLLTFVVIVFNPTLEHIWQKMRSSQGALVDNMEEEDQATEENVDEPTNTLHPNESDEVEQSTEEQAEEASINEGETVEHPENPEDEESTPEHPEEAGKEEQEEAIIGEETTDEERAEEEGQETAKEEVSEGAIMELDADTTASPEKEQTDAEGEFKVEVAEGDEAVSEAEINEKTKEFGEYDPTLDLSTYQLPPLDLMEAHGDGNIQMDKEELEANKDQIVNTLANYNIKVSKINATVGPTLTLYEIVPAAGVRISKIRNLQEDIALSLAALGIRIIAPIPGRGTVGIEVPNSKPQIVSMRSLIASDKFQNTDMELPIALGKTISNETFITDLAKMPHLLMAGATGQGKSVGLNAVLASLLYKKHPSQVKFVLVDPKKVELTLFNKLERHFLAKLPDTEEPIITDTSKVVNTLNSLCKEMDDRYELLKKAQVRGIKEYNKKFINRKLNPEKGHRYLPYIVLVVDEFADLIMTAGKDIEQPIARLAQLARAIGIHLIIATQRPSVNIITGMIKANFPARIAFRVTSSTDSRTILDAKGAEQLIGKGDMLMSTGSDLTRLQCAFIDTPEIEEVTEFIGSQRAYPQPYLLPEVEDVNSSGGGGNGAGEERDDYFEEAARLIVQHQQGSTSLIQRKLKLGYNRAGRIVDQLEEAGIIGPFEGSKARKVLFPDEYSLEQFLNQDENANNEDK